MSSMARWQRSDQFIGTQLEDSFVILSLEAASYYAFNTSANEIWELLERPQTLEQITHALMEKYEVNQDVCTQSVVRMVNELHANGLVHPAG